jgi:hypothetical protein
MKLKRTLVWRTGLSGAPGWIDLKLFTFGFLQAHSAIIHRTVRWVTEPSGGSPDCPVCQAKQRSPVQRSADNVNSAQTVRA